MTHSWTNANSWALYDAEYDLAPCENICKRVMIATIPRSGSTYFCLTIWVLNDFGRPLEYLNLRNRARDMMLRLGGGGALRYWRAVQRVRASQTGVFSYKAFMPDLVQVCNEAPELLPEVSSDAVIYFTRRDKLAQAISYARAHQTKSWFSDISEKRPPSYDSGAIDLSLEWIRGQEASWEEMFAKTGCEPLRVDYEELLEDTVATLQRVNEFLSGRQRPVHAPIQLAALRVQRDGASTAWRELYTKDRSGARIAPAFPFPAAALESGIRGSSATGADLISGMQNVGF